MIERFGRNRPSDPLTPEFEGEAEGAERRFSRSRSGVPGLVALMLSGVVLFLVWLSLWERNHPAAAAARGMRKAEVAGRLKAIHELEHLGVEDAEVAIPALIAGLSDSNAGVRSAAALALVVVINGAARTETGGVEVRDAIKALLESLKDPEPGVRIAAAQALWMIVVAWQGPMRVIDLAAIDDALEQVAGDPDSGVRLAAICGLGVIGPRISDEAPPALIAALEDESEKNRKAAAEYLARFPREVIRLIPSLVKSLERARPELRTGYAGLLGEIRPPVFSADAVPALEAALGSRDAEVRYRAASSLAAFGSAASKTVPALLSILKAEDGVDHAGRATTPAPARDPVVAVVGALGQLAPASPRAEEAVAALLKVVRSSDAVRRAAAVAALAGFRPDEAVMAAVTNSIQDRHESVRVASLRVVGDLGLKAPFAAPKVLAAALDDESADVRASAAGALAHVGLGIDPFLPTMVMHAEQDPDARVREAFVLALQELGPRAITTAAVPDLTAALGSRVAHVRIAAAIVLERLGPPAHAAIPALIRAIRAPVVPADSPNARFRAQDLDPMTGQVPGTPPVSGRTKDTRAEQQYWMIEALGRLAPNSAMVRESVAVLLEVLKPEESDVSTAALAALGKFGPAAAPAVPVLLRTLRQAIANRKLWLAVWCAATLSRVAPDTPSSREALTFLVGYLKVAPANGLLRFKTAEALGEFGPAAAEAVPSLIQLLTRGPLPGRIPAAKALGRIAPGTPQDHRAIAALAESLVTSPDFQGTAEVIEALVRFGPKAAVAIPRLKELERATNREVRSAAQKALATFKVTP
jgi:HEAT repeat protein